MIGVVIVRRCVSAPICRTVKKLGTCCLHRNLKTRSRIKPWQVKKGLCYEKFGWENSIYDLQWGAYTLGTFSPLFSSSSRFLVVRFLCMVVGRLP
jgi:hypothetical protein